jgi:hypothetical protein
MTKKTRYFMVGSVAILAVGLSIGLVAYYGGLPGIALSRAAGPQELRYIPRDAAVVAFVNVHDVMTSEFRQKMRELAPPGEAKGQQEFRDATGIDIENDIDHVVACMFPGESTPERRGLVLASGRFNQARIEGFIKQHEGTVQSYKGRKVFLHKATQAEGTSSHPGAEGMAVAFIGPNLAAFGPIGGVERAIDLEQGGESVMNNADMMKMIHAVEESNAWAVGRFDALANTARLPEQVTSQIPAITWFSASGRVNGGVSGTVSVEARDENAAKNLRDVVNGFMALARLQAGSKPELQTLVQSVQLGGTDKTVAISFTLPAAMLDILKSEVAAKKESKKK